MTTISQNFKVRITGIGSQSLSFRTEQNVKKKVAEIVYFEEPTTDAIRLDYVGSQEATPSSVLSIADRSDRMFPNSKNNKSQEFIGRFNSSAVSVQNKNFLVTQEFIASATKEIPLYFKAILPSSVVPESIKIYNSSFSEVSIDQYKVSVEYRRNEITGIPTEIIDYIYVFNSLENSFDYDTGEYNIYYLQYIDNEDSEYITKTTILNNSFAYNKATVNDFWELAPGTLKPWRYVYSFSTGLDSTSDYIISLPASTKYAIKYRELNRIKIIHPTDFSDEGPWFPRVYNGGFSYSYYGYSSKYEIPEYKNQSFNPIEPYKLAVRAKSAKVTDYLFKVPHVNLASPSLYSNIYIQLEEDGVIKYAITNDSTKEGTVVYDSAGKKIADTDGSTLLWRSDLLLGVDNLSGIVHLNIQILDDYDIYASYIYKEEYYTLSNLFLNSIFDRKILNYLYAVYLVPKNYKNHRYSSSSQESSIQWLKVSKSNIIEEVSQTTDTGNINLDLETKLLSSSGYDISGAIGLHYSWRASCSVNESTSLLFIESGSTINVDSTVGFPKSGWIRFLDAGRKYKYAKYLTKTDTSFTFSTLNEEMSSSYILNEETMSLVNFVDMYTNLSTFDGDDELSYYGLVSTEELPSIYCQYFLLGEVSINPSQQIKDLSIIDVRENGGGIDSDKYDEAKLLNPEIQWLSDNGNYNGQVFPGRSALVVKLPISLKEEFSLTQIKAIVQKWVPAGIFPVIQFYGYDPRIISVIPDTNSVTVEWEKEGEEFVYDIWYSTSTNGKFIKANNSRIVDGTGDTNTFTINGLTTGKSYIIRITMQDKYYQWWYSYDYPTSIGGGLGLTELAPTGPFGNTQSFKIYIEV